MGEKLIQNPPQVSKFPSLFCPFLALWCQIAMSCPRDLEITKG